MAQCKGKNSLPPVSPFSSVQSLSCVRLFVTPWTAARQASLSITNSRSLLKHRIGDAIQLSHPLSPLLFFCLLSFPASGSFPISWFFASGSQSIRASVSASALPVIIQGWFPLGLTDLISLLSKCLSRVFSNTTVQKHQFFSVQILYDPTLISIHDYCKNHCSDYMDLCWQSLYLLIHCLSLL